MRTATHDAMDVLAAAKPGLIAAAYAVARKYPGAQSSYAVPDELYPVLLSDRHIGDAFNTVVEYVRSRPTSDIDDSAF